MNGLLIFFQLNVCTSCCLTKQLYVQFHPMTFFRRIINAFNFFKFFNEHANNWSINKILRCQIFIKIFIYEMPSHSSNIHEGLNTVKLTFILKSSYKINSLCLGKNFIENISKQPWQISKKKNIYNGVLWSFFTTFSA